MKQIIGIALLLTVLATPGQVLAQKGIVRGQVIEDENGEPLFSANAVLKGTLVGTTTDFEGEFEIRAEAGTFDLEVSFIGMSATVITGVEVKPGEVTVIDVIRLKPASNELEAVTITADAARNTEEALITVRKKSANVMDGISAAKLKKTGDSDMGDAAKRVTGVSVEGGKYIYVRGLGDRYTKTMLNGVDIPGLDPDRNAIQIDIFPTDIIGNLTVLKTAVAELPADFAGGIVNIETQEFPTKPIFSVSAGAGYNPSMHFNSNYLTYPGGSTDFLGFDDGTRALPSGAGNNRIPSPAEPGFSDQQVNSFMQEFNPNLGVMKGTSLMDFGLGLALGDQKALKNGNKIGYIFSTTYNNETRFYDDVVYGEYVRPSMATDYDLEYTTIREGELGESNVLLATLGGLSYKTYNSKYQLSLLHLQNGESAAGEFRVDNSEALGQSGYRAFSNSLYYSQRSLTNLLLNGTHHLKDDKWVIDWRVSPTLSNIDEPDLRSTAFTITPQGDSVFNAGAGGNPDRYWRYLDEVNAVAKMDITRNLKLFEQDAKIKFGASHLYKERDYEILTYTLQSFGPQPHYNGDFNEILTADKLFQDGSGLFYNSGNSTPNANQYNSSVHNTAFYVSGEFSPFYRLKTIFGLRAENFVQRHTGRDQAGARGDASGNVLNNAKVLESLDLFPSANIIYAITTEQNFRISYFRSIARPSFKELSFAQILDPVSDRIFNGGLAPYPNQNWFGDLHETRIQNFDVRWERFMDRGELLSFSLFYKHFNNPIELVRIPEAQTNPEFQPRNVGDGQAYGAEVEVRKNLGFLSSSLNNFSLSGNFTYVYSRIDMTETEFEARKNFEKEGENIERTRTMAGQAPYIINAGLAYEDQNQFRAGAYYNVKGKTLEVVGGGAFPDVYTEPFHSINLTAGKTFGQVSVSLKVSNLLNDARESFYSGYRAQDQVFTRLRPGTQISVGFTYDIK